MANKRKPKGTLTANMRSEALPTSNDNPPPSRGQATNVKTSQKIDPIADALRKLHEAVAQEPMPSSFINLVSEIEAKIRQSRS